MSSDLRVALRFQANAGNARREIQAINQDLRKAGKEGAKALADEASKAGVAVSKAGREGAASYRIVRQVMRDAATQGAGVFRQDVIKTQAELKQLGQIGRQAAQETKNELVKADREGVQPLARSVDRADNSVRRMALNSARHLRTLKTIAAGVRAEFDRLRNFGSSTMGQLASLGVGVGVASSLKNSAVLERQLIRTEQTADMTPRQREEWKQEGRRIGNAYGADPAAIYTGGDTLLAGGLSYAAAKASADAMGQANAVTGADPAVLAGALMSGASAYNLDLEQPGVALDMLQKMTVAGRLGRAELENLADIFPKIGANAQAAGMSFEQSLAFVETLSAMEGAPDRLGTLAESTLRMFTNPQYRQQITKTTGISFFNKDGSSRNPLSVMGDLGKQYGRLSTDKERAIYMGTAFKGMDQDLLRGVRYMLSDGVLDTFSQQEKQVAEGAPVFNKNLADNTNSTTGTAGRMRSVLGGAIDRMAQPLNKQFADMGTYLLDDLNLSGEQLLAGGVAAGVGGYYAGRGAKAGAGALLNRFMGGPETLKNIAVGKVLEEATGVQSVFVTNWPATFAAAPMLGAEPSSKRGLAVPWALAGTALTMAQIGGSSPNSDADRLAGLPRNKLLSDNEKAYQAAYLRSRIALSGQLPEGLSYGQREAWLNDNARSAAQQETGLTATGGSVAQAQSWAAGVAGRLTDAALVPPGQTAQGSAEQRLQQLLSQPLIVEVRTDSHMVTAEVARRADIEMRRGQ